MPCRRKSNWEFVALLEIRNAATWKCGCQYCCSGQLLIFNDITDHIHSTTFLISWEKKTTNFTTASFLPHNPALHHSHCLMTKQIPRDQSASPPETNGWKEILVISINPVLFIGPIAVCKKKQQQKTTKVGRYRCPKCSDILNPNWVIMSCIKLTDETFSLDVQRRIYWLRRVWNEMYITLFRNLHIKCLKTIRHFLPLLAHYCVSAPQ